MSCCALTDRHLHCGTYFAEEICVFAEHINLPHNSMLCLHFRMIFVRDYRRIRMHSCVSRNAQRVFTIAHNESTWNDIASSRSQKLGKDDEKYLSTRHFNYSTAHVCLLAKHNSRAIHVRAIDIVSFNLYPLYPSH